MDQELVSQHARPRLQSLFDTACPTRMTLHMHACGYSCNFTDICSDLVLDPTTLLASLVHEKDHESKLGLICHNRSTNLQRVALRNLLRTHLPNLFEDEFTSDGYKMRPVMQAPIGEQHGIRNVLNF